MESVRDKDSRSGSTGLLHGVTDVGEDRSVQVCRAGLLGVGTTDNLGS